MSTLKEIETSKILARWESANEIHWVELRRNELGFYYLGLNRGGSLYHCDNELSAIAALQEKIDFGLFRTTNMRMQKVMT